MRSSSVFFQRADIDFHSAADAVEKIEPGYFEVIGDEGQLQNWDF
jgi:hypothetical protein